MPAPSAAADLPGSLRRELYFLTLYRLLEAALLCLLVFGPAGLLVDAPRDPLLARGVAAAYLMAALALFVSGRTGRLRVQAAVGVLVDIAAATLAMHALPGASAGIAMMLLFNIGAAGVLLPLAIGLGLALLAAAAFAAERVWDVVRHGSAQNSLAELSMFALGYLAIATLTHVLGRQLHASEALAERRGDQVANLAEINELIIRRMRTGVLLVDGEGRIRLANEAAMLQLGATHAPDDLLLAAPRLAARLQRWRQDGSEDAQPLQLGPDLPEVLPRFARLLAGDDQVLVFLDDTTLAARHAETLTLATLGRFSASLAHEIRNPLAAISYATQLLEESAAIPDPDRRLLGIVYQQTLRMNGIVENVLGLARRERARPEHVELVDCVRLFVEDYANCHPLEDDTLQAVLPPAPLPVLVDRQQLQQALTVLVHNARVHGHLPGQPARISVRVHQDAGGAPLLDVVDRGPGIPEPVVERLFRPFFTTSPHGTGLGLYIARELCMANQASLDYVPLPAGGACFRIRLLPAGARALAGT